MEVQPPLHTNYPDWLPAHGGEEVSESVLEGPQSAACKTPRDLMEIAGRLAR